MDLEHPRRREERRNHRRPSIDQISLARRRAPVSGDQLLFSMDEPQQATASHLKVAVAVELNELMASPIFLGRFDDNPPGWLTSIISPFCVLPQTVGKGLMIERQTNRGGGGYHQFFIYAAAPLSMALRRIKFADLSPSSKRFYFSLVAARLANSLLLINASYIGCV